VQLLVVLFEDALVVVLPELLGCILAGDSLEDLLAACIAAFGQ
jgi:predicted RNase H-like HicB family nuclease